VFKKEIFGHFFLIAQYTQKKNIFLCKLARKISFSVARASYLLILFVTVTANMVPWTNPENIDWQQIFSLPPQPI